ncbi:predicted protein [Phaeodactylum tricornutum CCAP 1055/1]|uniref:Serine-threonine kinase receptor-associated protein n=2 Tax=Phaeodactylum tricornutum TaxID=2850 RepID=B7G5M1_PHATC|nr:predicted protein [Phaeodactylum tricornutum CCAP 1055/1]EEC46172.1 predicted protein [Phaeodactylum tricornutum CCAP 1055/1]|eukprot:XP_002182271.1 predicted protein [Phaeodactylum tricornutum CCAP 1055/1]
MANDSKNTRKIPIVCPGHTRPLAELQFCYIAPEQRTFLVSACHDRLPMLRDGTSGDWIGTFVGHKGAVWSCRMDPSGSLAATASGDFSVHVWDAITGKDLFQLPHKHIVKTCDFSPNSKYLATGGHEGILRIYDLTQPEQAPITIPQDPSKKITITKCNWLSEDLLIVGCGDGKIRFWQPLAQGGPATVPVHTMSTEGTSEIRDMEVSRTTAGQDVLTVAAGERVYFFDLQTRTCLKSYKMPIHFREEGGASLHPSGNKFVAGGSDLWVRVFDYQTGEELELNKGHHGPIRCIRYSPTGESYATGSEDGTIRLWKTD